MADPAGLSVFLLYTMMLLFASCALAVLYWAVRSGAVADDEAPKYRMLEDELPEGGRIHGDAS
jgi:nitrogen fixation-related uncharacterized protein